MKGYYSSLRTQMPSGKDGRGGFCILNVLRIISDNPKYPPTELRSDMQDPVRILGKVVIWVHGEV